MNNERLQDDHPIFAACRNGDVEAVEKFLNQRISVRADSPRNPTLMTSDKNSVRNATRPIRCAANFYPKRYSHKGELVYLRGKSVARQHFKFLDGGGAIELATSFARLTSASSC